MAPDSLLVVTLPYHITIGIPHDRIWGTVETIVSGSVVALIAFLLARRRFKSERWHERRGELYGKLNELLHRVYRLTRPLAKDEDRLEDGLDAILPTEKSKALLEEAQAAQLELEERFTEQRYLLSSRAAGVVERYIDALESEGDTTMPQSTWHWHARDARRDFGELYQVEIGPDLGIWWRVRRYGRRIARAWMMLKVHVGTIPGRVKRAGQYLQFRFGPQLTQHDVPNPPRHKHQRTVAQMEQLGFSRVRIQQELRWQLAGEQQRKALEARRGPIDPPGPPTDAGSTTGR